MKVSRELRLFILTSLALAAAADFYAAVWDETANGGGNAGSLPASAQVVQLAGAPVSITQITGTLAVSNGVSEADLYQIYISDPANFSASTVNATLAPGVNAFDTQLFLFDSSGIGVAANDDNPVTGGPQSALSGASLGLQAGVYYLLITGSSCYPADAGLRNIFPNFTDGNTNPTMQTTASGPGGASPLAAYTGNSNEGGNYAIALTGVTSLPAIKIFNVSFTSGDTCLVEGRGVPTGRQARVEATFDLGITFVQIGLTTAADAGGNVQFLDTLMPDVNQRFYRLRYP